MQPWVYFILIANFIWSITALIDKIVVSKGYIKNPLVYLLSNGLMNLLFVFLLPFVGIKPIGFLDFMVALISGITLSGSLAVYYKALEYDEISKIVVLFQIGPVFVLILSYVLFGQLLSGNNLIGFLLLIFAGILVSYKKSGNTFRFSRAFYLMVLSMFLSAISIITAKHVFSSMGFWGAFLWIRIVDFNALAVLAMPSVRKDAAKTIKSMEPKIIWLLIFKMVIDFIGFIFGGLALSQGVVSLVSVLGSSTLPLLVFIITLITSLYIPNILSEDINKRILLTKIAAITLIITGIVFINV